MRLNLVRISTLVFFLCAVAEGPGVALADSAPDKMPSTKRVAVLYSSKFLMHDTGPGHPERPDRMRAVISRIRADEALSSRGFRMLKLRNR